MRSRIYYIESKIKEKNEYNSDKNLSKPKAITNNKYKSNTKKKF